MSSLLACHEQSLKDLLKLSEIRNISIAQVVQYKKSNIQLKEIQIDGLTFPEQSMNVNSNEQIRILWNGPRTWLIF